MRKRRAALLVDAGIWLRLAGDEDGARKLFEQALALDPDNAQAAQLASATSGEEVAKAPPAKPVARPAEDAAAARARAPIQSPAPRAAPRLREPTRPPREEAREAPHRPSPPPQPRDEGRGKSLPRPSDSSLRPTLMWIPDAGDPPDAPKATEAPEPPRGGVHKPFRPPPERRAPSRPPVPDDSDPGAPPPSRTVLDRPSPSLWPVQSVPNHQVVGSETILVSSQSPLLAPEGERGGSGERGRDDAQLSKQDAIVEYLRETDAYLRYGIYEKALEYAAKVLAEDPENDEAHEKAKSALLASKGSAAAFEQLLGVLRLYTARLDAQRAGPFLDELIAQQPAHPELPIFLSALRPYELGSLGSSDGTPLLDQALLSFLDGSSDAPMASPMGGDPLATLPPDATVPAGVQLPASLRSGHVLSETGALLPSIDAAASRAEPPVRAGDETVVFVQPPASHTTLFAQEEVEAEAPQPPFRRPKKRR